jgi:hypothetical protein
MGDTAASWSMLARRIRHHVALGADCVEQELGDEHRAELVGLLAAAGLDDVRPDGFRRYGSARRLYHFHSDQAKA